MGAQVRRAHEAKHPHRPLPMDDAKLAEVIRSAAASAILSLQRESSANFCARPAPMRMLTEHFSMRSVPALVRVIIESSGKAA